MVALKDLGAELAPVTSTSPEVPREAVTHAKKGNELVKRGDFEGALAEFDAALALHPLFPAALNNRAAALGYIGRLAEALADLEAVVRVQPKDAVALFNRALVRIMLDDYEGADEDLSESLSIRQSAAAYNNRGSVLAHLGKHHEAVADFNRSLELDARNLAARFNRSWSLFQIDDLDSALADVETVLAESDEETVPKDQLTARRREILDGYLWRMVRKGEVSWSGGKPQGSKNPVKLTPGPSISEYIIEERRRLRGH